MRKELKWYTRKHLLNRMGGSNAVRYINQQVNDIYECYLKDYNEMIN